MLRNRTSSVELESHRYQARRLKHEKIERQRRTEAEREREQEGISTPKDVRELWVKSEWQCVKDFDEMERQSRLRCCLKCKAIASGIGGLPAAQFLFWKAPNQGKKNW